MLDSLNTEQLAVWMRANGLSTGHGDNVKMLLGELQFHISDMRNTIAMQSDALKAVKARALPPSEASERTTP